MKKGISIVLSVALLLSLFLIFPTTVSAEASGDYEYNILDDGTAEIKKYIGSESELEIPSTLDGYDVTSIGKMAFYRCSSLTSLIIPDSVKTLEESSFSNCGGLKSVKIGDSVITIGSKAFYWCNSLNSVNFGNSVKNINNSAFYYCRSLADLNIPDSVTSISNSAFDNTAWYNNQSNGLVYAGKVAYNIKGTCPSEIVIKEGTLSIASKAFADCSNLISVIIPDTVSIIGGSAFYNCSRLVSVNIPESVTSIGTSAFYQCSSLSSVTLPHSLTRVSDFAFQGCSNLKSVTIPDSVTIIGYQSFAKCSILSSMTIPDYVTVIGTGAFTGCSKLVNVTIPDSVTTIGSFAFKGCQGLTSIDIPDSVTELGIDAFSDCINLKSVCLNQEGVDKFRFSFDVDYVETVILKESVTNIGDSAFKGCTGLRSIYISKFLTNIVMGAFSNCVNLKSIIVDPQNRTFDSRDNCNAIIETRKNDLIVGCSNTIIEDSVTGIGGYAFKGCTGLTKINIPDSVKTIDYDAFSDCTGLTSVIIPKSVWYINHYAFSGCTNLKNLTFFDSGTGNIGIGLYAFYGCTNLTSVTLPDTVDSINEKAFGYYYENNTEKRIEGFTVYGYTSKVAYDYAWYNYFDYVKLVKKNDENTGITIDIPEDMDFSVRSLTGQEASEFGKGLPNKLSVKSAYDITVTLNGSVVQPSNNVKVKIPCDNQNVLVYQKNNDDSFTNMNAEYMDGYMVFYSDNLGDYLIVEKTDEEQSFIGDVNNNGEIDINDATTIQKHIAAFQNEDQTPIIDESDTDSFAVADVNCDGIISISDVTLIQQYIAGMIDKFV